MRVLDSSSDINRFDFSGYPTVEVLSASGEVIGDIYSQDSSQLLSSLQTHARSKAYDSSDDQESERIPSLTVAKSSVKRGSAVTIRFSDLPGNDHDWIALAPANSAENYYNDDMWTYTYGKSDGEIQFTPSERGTYEARLYLNWPNGGYTIVDRCTVTVK